MTKTSRVMLAVLALCGTSAALAQSSVTLYGRVNTTIEDTKIGKDSVTGLNSNGSFIGFRGQEDLGAGVKVGFKLEGEFNSDDGSGKATTGGLNFERHSELNMAGNFGTLRMGTFLPASYEATADIVSMHNHDVGQSADALFVFNARNKNKVAYVTPNFGGLTAELQTSFHEETAGGESSYDLGLNYANGPLGLGLGYTNGPLGFGGLKGDRVRSNDGQQLALRATYALGALTLGGYYQYAKLDNAGVFDNGGTTATATGDVKRHAYRLSAKYVVGASEFHANIGRADKVKLGNAKQAGTSATQWTLGYNYNLSKRTKVYGYYSKIDNGAGANYFNAAKPETAQVNGADQRSIAVGVRHLF